MQHQQHESLQHRSAYCSSTTIRLYTVSPHLLFLLLEMLLQMRHHILQYIRSISTLLLVAVCGRVVSFHLPQAGPAVADATALWTLAHDLLWSEIRIPTGHATATYIGAAGELLLETVVNGGVSIPFCCHYCGEHNKRKAAWAGKQVRYAKAESHLSKPKAVLQRRVGAVQLYPRI